MNESIWNDTNQGNQEIPSSKLDRKRKQKLART